MTKKFFDMTIEEKRAFRDANPITGPFACKANPNGRHRYKNHDTRGCGCKNVKCELCGTTAILIRRVAPLVDPIDHRELGGHGIPVGGEMLAQ